MITWLRQNFYIFIALNTACLYLANDMFLPAIRTIASTYQVQESYVSFGIGAFLFGSFSFQLFAGPVADILGYKRSIFYSNIFFIFASAGVAFAPSLFWFLLFRTLQGLGICMFPTAGFASINTFYHDKKAVLALAITTSIVFFSPIAGPIIGALILEVSTWRGIFLIDLVATIITSSLLYIFMPDVKKKVPEGETEAPKTSFIQVVLNMRVFFKNKPFMQLCIAMGFFSGIISAWITASPHMLMGNLHLSAEHYSFVQTPVLIAFLVANTFSPFLIRKRSSHSVLTKAMSFFVAYSIILFILYTVFHSFSLTIILCTLCSIFFMRGLTNAIQVQTTLSLERTFQASSAGFLQFINRAFSITSSFLVSSFYAFPNQVYVIGIIFLAFMGSSFTLIGLRSSRLSAESTASTKSKS